MASPIVQAAYLGDDEVEAQSTIATARRARTEEASAS